LEPAWSSDGVTGFLVGDFRLEIASHDQVAGRNNTPARHFFDLRVNDVDAEFERIVGLGATVIQRPYAFSDEALNMVIATLADLDGNYFQLVSLQAA
jgi:predicted enzyme related to lactoylglutathione lyase